MTHTRSSHTGSAPSSAPGVDAEVFARRYLAHAGTQLPGHTDAQLAKLAESNLAFGAVRNDGDVLVRVIDTDGHTAIDIVTEDAPYLVDSVRA